MSDPERSEAARTLSRARWGSTRTDRLVAELAERADELTEVQREALREVADERKDG